MKGLNLSRFKKVASDRTHVHMRSPEGHTISIARQALSHKMLNALDALPMSSMAPEEAAAQQSLEAQSTPMMASGGKLDANARKHIAGKNFALPDRRYPINDPSHARNALARVSQHGSPHEKAVVRQKVHAKYPGIEVSRMSDGGETPIEKGQQKGVTLVLGLPAHSEPQTNLGSTGPVEQMPQNAYTSAFANGGSVDQAKTRAIHTNLVDESSKDALENRDNDSVSGDVKVHMPPNEIVAKLSGSNNGNVGGTIRDGSKDEIFVVGNMIFSVDAAKRVSKGKSNSKALCSNEWSQAINVEEDHAIKADSTNPVLIAQIPMEDGSLEPLLFDGHHRMYRAMSEGQTDIPAYVFTPEESLAVMSAPPDLMYKLRDNLKKSGGTQRLAKGGVVRKKMADGGSAADDSQQPIEINVNNPNQPLPEALINRQAGQLASNLAQAQGNPYLAPSAAQAPNLYGVDPEEYAKEVVAQNTPAPDNTAPTAPTAPMPASTADQPDPWGTNAYLGRMTQADTEMQSGLQAQAQAEQQVGAQEAAALRRNIDTQRLQQQTFQDNYNQLNAERMAFQNDLMNGHIDPNHYLNSMGTGQKIAAAIGLLAGGIGGAITHQQNPALMFMQNQINNDIEAQRLNLGKQQGLLSANLRQFGNMRDAMDMTRVMQADIVSNQMKLASAQAASPAAKANLMKASAQWDAQMAPVMSQIAMRRTLLSGGVNGQIPPEQIIRMLVPENEKAAAMKELQTAQNMSQLRDNTLGAFDQISNMTMNGLFSPNQKAALIGPLLAQMVKDSEGRITPTDIPMIGGMFPSPTDGAGTNQLKRQQLEKFLTEKFNFPILTQWGINPFYKSRYAPGGTKKVQIGPVAQ